MDTKNLLLIVAAALFAVVLTACSSTGNASGAAVLGASNVQACCADCAADCSGGCCEDCSDCSKCSGEQAGCCGCTEGGACTCGDNCSCGSANVRAASHGEAEACCADCSAGC